MTCHQCGQSLPDGTRFCGFCGAQQNVVPETIAQSPNPLPPPMPPPMPTTTASPVVKSGVSTKTIATVIGIFFLLILIGSLTLWLWLFPPGVYVKDSYSRENDEIADQIKEVGATVNNGFLDVKPGNDLFYALIYQTPASSQATIEATAIFKDGDENAMMGLVCCGSDNKNFIGFMMKRSGVYQIYQYLNGKWYPLAEDLSIPKSVKLQQDTPYQMKVVIEKEYLSFYWGDMLLIKVMDAFSDHKGRFGIYAQGGKAGNTTISFDFFKAKKNSLFQKDQ
ncbi:MAG TPA: zinc-ribbon domain-containing protein [Acidobacteriota bacterium]|nr:zinc-ribbon domain-containing protein [Acidobacteriota bacterium]